MKRYYELINLRGLLPVMGSLFLLASCSSYQYAGYDNDGIYSSSTGEAYTANDYEESYEDALYYKNLFGETAEQLEALPADGAIFTDVESYASGQYEENSFGPEGTGYEPGRAAWGSDPDEIAINIYHDYNPFYSYPYYAGFYDPFWGPRYYGYGYYNPYRYGYPFAYHSWGWNWGFGFGWGHYGYGYSPYYPYSYRHAYYAPYYNHEIAYNNTRRAYKNTDYRSSTNDTRLSRVQGYSNTRDVRAASGRDGDARTYQTRTTRVRSSSLPVRSSDGDYRRTYERRDVPTVRRTAPVRSSSPQVRSTRSSSSNNSTYRSSSSSSNRSTGSSPTSRSSRGRNN